MKTHNFSLEEVKQVDMVEYLEKLGHQPKKIRCNDYWYLSPLRNEKEPSFKVNRKLNAWYDHGMGQGGYLIDFGILYYGCSVKDFIEKLSRDDFLFHQPALQVRDQAAENEQKIKIVDQRPLSNSALLYYLKERRIPLDIAGKYCREVDYELYGKKYFAIGFENNSGGFELRNAYFKGSNSPKDSTLIQTEGAGSLCVVEGFFSFLSWVTINQNQSLPPTDYLVLNSLSLIGKNLDRMQSYRETKLMLDNDAAGDKATSRLLQISSSFKDNRNLYTGYKDLNHWLTEFGKPIRMQNKLLEKNSDANNRSRNGRRID